MTIGAVSGAAVPPINASDPVGMAPQDVGTPSQEFMTYLAQHGGLDSTSGLAPAAQAQLLPNPSVLGKRVLSGLESVSRGLRLVSAEQKAALGGRTAPALPPGPAAQQVADVALSPASQGSVAPTNVAALLEAERHMFSAMIQVGMVSNASHQIGAAIGSLVKGQ